MLIYPEGVWYLIEKGKEPKVTVQNLARHLQNKIDRMSVSDTSKLLQEAKGVGFKFTQNPFALGMSAKEVVNLWENRIMDSKDKSFQDKYEKMVSESPKKCFSGYKKWMKESEKRLAAEAKAQKNLEKALQQSGLPSDFTEADEVFLKLPEKKKESIRKKHNEYEKIRKEISMENGFASAPLWESEPENLFSSDLNVLRAGKLVGSLPYLLIEHLGFDSETAWNLAAEQAGISCTDYPELMFFDRQSDRGFRTAVILDKNGIDFNTITERYTAFLASLCETGNDPAEKDNTEISDYISAHLRQKYGNMQTDRNILKKYMESNHKQCCHCGGGYGSKLDKGNIPQKIKLQYFSNRLKGGSGDPVRNACEICRQNFLIEKLFHETYENHYYLHLFADGGEYSSHAEPGIFLDALKNGIMALQSTDCRSFFIQHGKLVREYLEEKIS
ncbi:MAG: hypothetical protein R2941_21415, partial [Desulfobacterales bacterium]